LRDALLAQLAKDNLAVQLLGQEVGASSGGAVLGREDDSRTHGDFLLSD